MQQFKTIIILSLFSLFFGCNKSSNSARYNLKEITEVKNEDGFKDVYLKIVSEETSGDSKIYIAKGLFNSKVVGLKFEIKSNMPNGIKNNGSLDAKNGFIKNGIKIYSIGEESDEFAKALSKLYEFPSNKGFTVNTLYPTAFSLNASIVELDKLGYYKFKLFFKDNENDNVEDYCELFLNINTAGKTIEILEKDPEYRSLLIKAFTEL